MRDKCIASFAHLASGVGLMIERLGLPASCWLRASAEKQEQEHEPFTHVDKEYLYKLTRSRDAPARTLHTFLLKYLLLF